MRRSQKQSETFLKQLSAAPCLTIKQRIDEFADGKGETVSCRAARWAYEMGSAFCFEFSTVAL
jgi:hypothetical protein